MAPPLHSLTRSYETHNYYVFVPFCISKAHLNLNVESIFIRSSVVSRLPAKTVVWLMLAWMLCVLLRDLFHCWYAVSCFCVVYVHDTFCLNQ
jgi:hypothetical protein